jgi:hypothetical protein
MCAGHIFFHGTWTPLLSPEDLAQAEQNLEL